MAETEVLREHPIDAILQLFQVADVEVSGGFAHFLHASGKVFEMPEEGKVGKLDLLWQRSVWLRIKVTHRVLVRPVRDGDEDSGRTQVWNSGTNFIYGSTEFNLHIGVVAKLGVFFLEPFDEFQGGILWGFHFTFGYRFI
jgi:hypothetical protein